MPATAATAESAIQPITYRLPKPGKGDPHFNLSRSFYYELDKRFLKERGEGLLVHICAEGKRRGVTVIPFAKMAAYMREQMEAQDGEAK